MKGDRVLKSEMNDYWPKFFLDENKRPVLADSSEDIPEDEWVYQPRFGNLVGDSRLMVTDPTGAYVFALEGLLILWGSMYVKFSDNYRYNVT